MILGIPYFGWIVILAVLIGVVIILLGWYMFYCVFDWGVHYVKHVWEEKDEDE